MAENPEQAQELTQLRQGIDAIDSQLVQLVNQRAKLAHRIGEVKQGAIYRPEREAQVLRRVAEENPGPLDDKTIQRIIREVMSACRAMERPLIIAYLGPAGSYSESAARKHFGSSPSFVPCATFNELFQTVESKGADYAVVPVENSTGGAVIQALDMLLSTTLKICSEVTLPVHHNLLSQQLDLSSINKVYAHTQSLTQCNDWLDRNLPNADRVAVSSNSEAARMAADEQSVAAIAGEAAAEIYGLPILAMNIEDDPRNTTRFVVLADQDAAPSGQDKTSLICSAPHVPGAVHDLLTPLAENGVSMTRFESRPARNAPGSLWEYYFYIDIEGHRLDDKVVRSLEGLRRRAAFVKELGSYPRAVY